MREPIIHVQSLTKKFKKYRKYSGLRQRIRHFLKREREIIRAVTDLNFTIHRGDHPPSIYVGITHLVIYTIVPAAFVTFLPLHLFMSFEWTGFFWLIIYLIIIATTANILFYKGLRKYESGNTFTMNL